MLSRSRWLVGSSSISTFAPEIIILQSIHLTLSPPESTLAGLSDSSPLKSILPSHPLMSASYLSPSLAYGLSHSSRESVQSSKYFELSLGKYAVDVVTPHLNEPSSGSSSPQSIWKSVVLAISSAPTNATLSLGIIIKLTSLSTFLPFTVLERFLTSRTSLPTSLSCLNEQKGYLLDDTLIVSIWRLSSSFLRDVACLDLEALALNLWINSVSSFIFCSALLFWSLICLSTI